MKETYAVEKCLALMADLKRAKDDVGVDEIAIFLDVAPKNFSDVMKSEKKFLQFLKENEEKIERVLTECKNNASDGKEILKKLLNSGVPHLKVARYLGYQGNDYGEFFERLFSKKFWGYSLYERVSSAETFFFSDGKPVREGVNYVSLIQSSSLLFATFFRLFAVVECYRKRLVSFRQVIKAIFDLCDLLVDEYKFSYGAVLYVLFEVISVQVANENLPKFGMLYLKQNRKRDVIEEVKNWLKSEDKKKKNVERKTVFVFLSMLFSLFYNANEYLIEVYGENREVFNRENVDSFDVIFERFDAFKRVAKNKKALEKAAREALTREEVEREEKEEQ